MKPSTQWTGSSTGTKPEPWTGALACEASRVAVDAGRARLDRSWRTGRSAYVLTVAQVVLRGFRKLSATVQARNMSNTQTSPVQLVGDPDFENPTVTLVAQHIFKITSRTGMLQPPASFSPWGSQ